MATSKDDVLSYLETATMVEISELIGNIEKKFGVTAMVAAPAVGAAGANAETTPEEEKTEFDVVLKEFGSSKIAVIKEVRAITGLGLKEAKELVESAPKEIKEAVSKSEADEIKEKLEKAGAVVEVK